MSNNIKKAKFIAVWYKKECRKLSFPDSIKLAKTWIELCIKDDEYEMASSIKREKEKIVSEYIKNKRKTRTRKQRVKVRTILFKRFFRTMLRKVKSLFFSE